MSKAKGTRNEHRAIRYLSDLGYRCHRMAASLSEWDVIAVNEHRVLLVQVKTNQWVRPAERSVMEAYPCPAVAHKLQWRWDSGKRTPRIRVWGSSGWSDTTMEDIEKIC